MSDQRMSRIISFEELAKAPVSDLPTKIQIDAWYDGTKGMCDFSTEVMIPLLKSLLRPSPQECAITQTYFRMCLFLRSVIALNSLQHFQSVASGTRSLFELWLDVEYLAQDPNGDVATKFLAFAEQERYRVAGQVIRFADSHPSVLKMDISPQRAFYSDPQRKTKFGNSVKQENWTGKNIRDLAKHLGHEAIYVEAYPILSWYVHAGSSGTMGVSKESLEAIFGFCHSLIQRIFVNATSTCAKITKISAVEYFDSWVKGLKLKTGELIIREQIKLLQEKSQSRRAQ